MEARIKHPGQVTLPRAHEARAQSTFLSRTHARSPERVRQWTDANLTAFTGYIEKYPGVVAMSLAGHTHMDEFRLMSPGNALSITAGISPFFGNNPAYKIFTVDSLSLAPTDYSAVSCNPLATPAAFSDYYTFSQACGTCGGKYASRCCRGRPRWPPRLASSDKWSD